jgi:hypothetical protein
MNNIESFKKEHEKKMSATAEAIDNLRRLSDSIKSKIQQQEIQNQTKRSSKYSDQHKSGHIKSQKAPHYQASGAGGKNRNKTSF